MFVFDFIHFFMLFISRLVTIIGDQHIWRNPILSREYFGSFSFSPLAKTFLVL